MATPAGAADFIELSNQPIPFDQKESGQCTHKMVGEIVAGDAEKLAAMIDNLPGQDHDNLNFIICMDSTGGKLNEGLRIGALLNENYFGTYVPKGATCLSACAVAFMHGTIAAWEYLVTFRMLHPEATLGFHAPALGIEANADQMVPFALVQGAYQATMTTIADIVEGASKPVSNFSAPIIPLSLLSHMLGTGPDEFVYVDNLHKAFMWNITIFPKNLTPPKGFDLELGFYQMCENAGYKIDPGSYGKAVPGAFGQQDLRLATTHSYPWKVDIPRDHKLLSPFNIWNRQCSYKYRKDRDDFVLRRYVDGKMEREVWLPPVYLFAPSTTLATIAPK